MGLGEPERGERFDPGIDLVRHLAGDAVVRHPRIQAGAEFLDLLHPPFGAHRPPQQVRLAAGQVADGGGDLHQLLLEQRDPFGPLQHRLQRRVEVGDRFAAVRPPDVRMHRTALDGAGPDQADLDRQVVERPWAAACGRVPTWARDSTWNTPIESARHNMSNTPGSSFGIDANDHDSPK